jgi:hypothetical protein
MVVIKLPKIIWIPLSQAGIASHAAVGVDSCSSSMVIRDDVTDAEEIVATMTRLGLCSTPPPFGRAAKSSCEVQYVFEDC